MSIQTRSRVILGIDPGFDRMGIAVISGNAGKMELVHSECITTNPKQDHAKRLLILGEQIKKIIKTWKPEALAIETLFFNKNITSAIGVAEARGVALYEAVGAGLSISEYSPQAIKIAVTGYGKADKLQVEQMIKKLVYLPEKSRKKLDDELDAIAVGITHLATQKGI